VPSSCRARRSMFVTKKLRPSDHDYPDIGQKHLSGAASRMMINWFAECSENTPDTDINRLLRDVLWSLQEFFVVLASHGQFLESDASPHPMEVLQQCYYTYRSKYNSLALAAIDLGQIRWPVRPKNHQLEHMVLDFAPLRNPRYVQCMLDEDMMRFTKRIVVRTHPHVFGTRTLMLYLVAVSLRWVKGV
ncbi:unnamed protein product, partial [Effrenium voratum]